MVARPQTNMVAKNGPVTTNILVKFRAATLAVGPDTCQETARCGVCSQVTSSIFAGLTKAFTNPKMPRIYALSDPLRRPLDFRYCASSGRPERNHFIVADYFFRGPNSLHHRFFSGPGPPRSFGSTRRGSGSRRENRRHPGN